MLFIDKYNNYKLFNLTYGKLGTTLITQDLLEYANSLPAGFYSISTTGDTPNAIGVAATGYILRRTGVDTIVALYGISSGTLNVNHYNGHTWLGWLKYTTNTDLQTAIATGNTVRQCVNATTDSQTKKFLIGRPNDAPAFTASRALLTVTKYNTFTFLTLQSTFDEVFVAFLYENDTITSSIWKRIDNTVGNLATEGRLGLDYNSTTKILSLYLGSNRIGTINVN